eukprot:jgi/Ulvmu1/12314/UM088_0034.1
MCRSKLALSVASLVCALGMIAVYVTSLALLRASAMSDAADRGSLDPDSGGGGGGSHTAGSLAGTTGTSNRSAGKEAFFICFSILLTLGAFAVKLVGVRRMLRAGAAATSALRRSAHLALSRPPASRKEAGWLSMCSTQIMPVECEAEQGGACDRAGEGGGERLQVSDVAGSAVLWCWAIEPRREYLHVGVLGLSCKSSVGAVRDHGSTDVRRRG